MLNFVICDECGGIGKPDTLTPVHLRKRGTLYTLFFHNRHKNDCLSRMLADMKVLFEAFGKNQPEASACLRGNESSVNSR
jgi:hypothetical protein